MISLVLYASLITLLRLKFFNFLILNLMKDKLYDNADSFAMSFDDEWKKIECDDLRLKI